MTYHCLHIPTGQTFERTAEGIHSHRELYRMIAKWNADQPGVWQYWI